MREESCPQRIGKSHRLHPAEQVVKVQHAAVLAPLCAPRTSITAAATAWAAHAEALMTLVATMTSIPRELKTQVLFVSSKKSGRLSFPTLRRESRRSNCWARPLHTTHMHVLPHTCTGQEHTAHAKATDPPIPNQRLGTGSKPLGGKQSSFHTQRSAVCLLS